MGQCQFVATADEWKISYINKLLSRRASQQDVLLTHPKFCPENQDLASPGNVQLASFHWSKIAATNL